jgi:RNA polymerase sigma-70 factor (ECF subfamily)
MNQVALAKLATKEPDAREAPFERLSDSVIRGLVAEHHRFIWRLLARLGVPERDVDDATQQVFMVLTQRNGRELKAGSERSFLFGIAINVAHTHRRTLARRREIATDVLPEAEDLSPTLDVLSDQRRARSMLDQLLEEMPFDLRVVFVLYELDDMQTQEIGSLLDLPTGTVASRLRRAREWFQRRVKQLQTRIDFTRGGP